VAQLADGVYFNAGQSCCAIERIYVHRDRFGELVEAFVASARGYVLGNPLDADTTLGPAARPGAAAFVRGQVTEAVAKGARTLIDPRRSRATVPAPPTSRRRCSSTSTMACG
jgi:acyl-CoA reductase-like NAD-dependent aldehyde dehydrogenase